MMNLGGKFPGSYEAPSTAAETPSYPMALKILHQTNITNRNVEISNIKHENQFQFKETDSTEKFTIITLKRTD